jgi:hypothetical protein
MTKIINCDCGHVVRGDTDGALVAAAQKHARDAHGMELTPRPGAATGGAGVTRSATRRDRW